MKTVKICQCVIYVAFQPRPGWFFIEFSENEKFVMSKYDKDVPAKASISFFPPFRVQWLCQPSSVCSFCGDVPTMGADSQEDPIHQRGPLLRLGASHHRHGHQQVGCACLCGFLTHSAAFVFLSYYCCIHWWCHRAYQQPRLHTIPDPDPQNRRKPNEASFCTRRSLPLLAMRKPLVRVLRFSFQAQGWIHQNILN